MKLCFEFKSVISALLNMSFVPSFDTCLGELSRVEQCLLTQGSMTHDVTLSEPTLVAYVAHNKSKGHEM